MKRWTATVFYRSDVGLVDVMYVIDELSELYALIERGPNFYTIEQIVITHNRPDIALTLEESYAQ